MSIIEVENMGFKFNDSIELMKICSENNIKISDVMIAREEAQSGLNRDQIITNMKEYYGVMERAINEGIISGNKSVSGLIGGDAKLLNEYMDRGVTASGKDTLTGVAAAMAVLEVNASMGQVIAAPTAGSCGILPGVIIPLGKRLGKSMDDVISAIFTASAIGMIVTQNATVSGAEGGCQAETGTAAAMSAAAGVELMGGTPEASIHAAAMTIKNILGLVCDPIAGLVECPCVKRNAIGTANALISIDMAMAGIRSVIPFDEVVDAMYRVGKTMSPALRETAEGGLAATPTGKRIMKEIYG